MEGERGDCLVENKGLEEMGWSMEVLSRGPVVGLD
jgi:hypothetical protein